MSSYLSPDGKEKLCTGPGHDEPTWLPATEKYFYRHKTGRRTGTLSARCRLCQNWDKLKSPGVSGFVPIAMARPFYIEGVHRVGMMEFSRRAGISPTAIRKVIKGKGVRFVQKRKLRSVMLEVISMRRKNEVRHRDSISHGTSVRKATVRKAHTRTLSNGKVIEMREQKVRAPVEKPVTNIWADIYRRHGDSDAEDKQHRRKDPDFRERENERTRKHHAKAREREQKGR